MFELQPWNGWENRLENVSITDACMPSCLQLLWKALMQLLLSVTYETCVFPDLETLHTPPTEGKFLGWGALKDLI